MGCLLVFMYHPQPYNQKSLPVTLPLYSPRSVASSQVYRKKGFKIRFHFVAFWFCKLAQILGKILLGASVSPLGVIIPASQSFWRRTGLCAMCPAQSRCSVNGCGMVTRCRWLWGEVRWSRTGGQ